MHRRILASLAILLSLMAAPATMPATADAATINIYIGTSLNHGRGITCWEGERLLRNRGFRDIRRVSCHGRYFVYRGWRGGIRSEIHIRQRDGRVVNIRRLNW